MGELCLIGVWKREMGLALFRGGEAEGRVGVHLQGMVEMWSGGLYFQGSDPTLI